MAERANGRKRTAEPADDDRRRPRRAARPAGEDPAAPTEGRAGKPAAGRSATGRAAKPGGSSRSGSTAKPAAARRAEAGKPAARKPSAGKPAEVTGTRARSRTARPAAPRRAAAATKTAPPAHTVRVPDEEWDDVDEVDADDVEVDEVEPEAPDLAADDDLDDDLDDDFAEDEPAAEPPARRRRRRRVARPSLGRPSPVAAAVAIVIAALVAGLVYSGLRISDQDHLNSLRSSAIKAATRDALAMTTYSYQSLTQDFDKVLSCATPSFKQGFQQSSGALENLFPQYKASATGTVRAVGVMSVTSIRAVVLVAVDQKITNSTQKNGPQTQTNRLEETLVHPGGSCQWLIDNATLV